MTDLGIHYFLSVKIKQNAIGSLVSNKKYENDLLMKFTMLKCKHAVTLMNTSEKLPQNDGIREVDTRRYQSMVGYLIYLTHTRPNIAFSIGV